MLALANPFGALAHSPLETQATTIVDQLIYRLGPGTCLLGDVNLCKIREQILSVHWEAAQLFTPIAEAGSRRSAYYVLATKQVVTSPFLPQQTKDFQPTLALHEALGALGYYDGNYEASLLLTIIAESHTELRDEFTSLLVQLVGPRTKKIVLAGGSTSVGGGGDVYAILMKLRALDVLLHSGKEFYASFLTWFLSMPMEPSYEPGDVGLVLIPEDEWYPFKFVVPVNVLSESPAAQASIASEIADVATSFMEPRPNSPFEVLESCNYFRLSVATTRPKILNDMLPELREIFRRRCGEKPWK